MDSSDLWEIFEAAEVFSESRIVDALELKKLVLNRANGRRIYSRIPAPDYLQVGSLAAQKCFVNAAEFSHDNEILGLSYVEGFARPEGMEKFFHHAWVSLGDGDEAIEVSPDYMNISSDYIGIPMNPESAHRYQLELESSPRIIHQACELVGFCWWPGREHCCPSFWR